MIKDGKIRIGKTPSVVSGRDSTMVKNGEALCWDEEDVGLKNLDTEIRNDTRIRKNSKRSEEQQ